MIIILYLQVSWESRNLSMPPPDSLSKLSWNDDDDDDDDDGGLGCQHNRVKPWRTALLDKQIESWLSG